MASKKTKEKIGFKDLVTFAKAGWTPEETNALLDRLDAMGDPNDPDVNDNEGEDDESDTDEEDEEDSDDEDESDGDDEGSDDSDNSEDDSDENTSLDANMKKMKKLLADEKKKNARLEADINKMQKKNKGKDVSGEGSKKSLEDSLIDAFQSCF